jgi:hypothetical protein
MASAKEAMIPPGKVYPGNAFDYLEFSLQSRINPCKITGGNWSIQSVSFAKRQV